VCLTRSRSLRRQRAIHSSLHRSCEQSDAWTRRCCKPASCWRGDIRDMVSGYSFRTSHPSDKDLEPASHYSTSHLISYQHGPRSSYCQFTGSEKPIHSTGEPSKASFRALDITYKTTASTYGSFLTESSKINSPGASQRTTTSAMNTLYYPLQKPRIGESMILPQQP